MFEDALFIFIKKKKNSVIGCLLHAALNQKVDNQSKAHLLYHRTSSVNPSTDKQETTTCLLKLKTALYETKLAW
jgi:hypothetical protein